MIGQFLVRDVMYEPNFKGNLCSFSFNSAAATNKSISTEKATKSSVIVIKKALWSVCSNNNNNDNNNTIRRIFLVM